MPTRQIVFSVQLENADIDSLSELMTNVKGLKNVSEAVVLQSEESRLGATFGRELEMLLNRHSKEAASNTPDYVLASYLQACLASWDLHTKERDRWFGNRSLLGPANDYPSVPTNEATLLGKDPSVKLV